MHKICLGDIEGNTWIKCQKLGDIVFYFTFKNIPDPKREADNNVTFLWAAAYEVLVSKKHKAVFMHSSYISSIFQSPVHNSTSTVTVSRRDIENFSGLEMYN